MQGTRPVKNAESWEHLVAQIRQLPEPQQQVMALRYVESFENPQIAEAMKMPLEQVELTLRQAYDMLRPALRRASDWQDDTP